MILNNSAPIEQKTPIISVSSSGLITATAGDKTATQQLTTQGAQTITPGTSAKTIASQRYLTGTQTIAGDANLTSANIKSGVSIFGVNGSYEGLRIEITSMYLWNSTTGRSCSIDSNQKMTIQGFPSKPIFVFIRPNNNAIGGYTNCVSEIFTQFENSITAFHDNESYILYVLNSSSGQTTMRGTHLKTSNPFGDPTFSDVISFSGDTLIIDIQKATTVTTLQWWGSTTNYNIITAY